MRRHAAAALVLALGPLVAGCGLPLSGGVQRPGEVAAAERLPAPINVLPPGPQPGATPEAVVLGFLAAQISARDAHGIARSFLAPAERDGWRDDAGVTVYEPRTATVGTPVDDGDGVLVDLSLDVVGEVAADGSARVQPPERTVQRYRLRRDDRDQWQLVQVPHGLTLSPAGRDRAFDPVSVHFLAPRDAPDASRHLVADLLQLPADGDRAPELVERLLAGPSLGLGASAQTAVPEGTRLLEPVRTSPDGEVLVDLSEQVLALPPERRQELSAQLVWTLRQVPDFTRLRLLAQGTPFAVPGADVVQPETAWSGYAPEGPVERPAGLALVGGMLRVLDPPTAERPPPRPPSSAGSSTTPWTRGSAGSRRWTADGTRRSVLVGALAGPLEQVAGPATGCARPRGGAATAGCGCCAPGRRPRCCSSPRRGSGRRGGCPWRGCPTSAPTRCCA